MRRRLNEDIYDKVNTAIKIVRDLYIEGILSRENYNAIIDKLNEEDPGDYNTFDEAVNDLIKYSKDLLKASTAFNDVFFGICNEFA